MVLVSRLVHPLASATRVLLLVPPLASREMGFAQALAAVKTLAARTGLSVRIVTPSEQTDALTALVAQTDPEVPYKVQGLAAWEDLVDALDAATQPDDVLCLVSVRRGRLAWHPGLLHLPRLLAQRFPGNDFITAYLSEVETKQIIRAAVDPEQPGERFPALPTSHVIMDLADEGLIPVLTAMLARRFPKPEAGMQAEHLAALVEAYAPEVAPGIVFYHLHTDTVDEAELLLGLSRAGISLPRTGQPTRVVLVLLAPQSMTPEDYLRLLALCGHLLHHEKLAERLLEAPTPEEVRSLLYRELHDPPLASD